MGQDIKHIKRCQQNSGSYKAFGVTPKRAGLVEEHRSQAPGILPLTSTDPYCSSFTPAELRVEVRYLTENWRIKSHLHAVRLCQLSSQIQSQDTGRQASGWGLKGISVGKWTPREQKEYTQMQVSERFPSAIKENNPRISTPPPSFSTYKKHSQAL